MSQEILEIIQNRIKSLPTSKLEDEREIKLVAKLKPLPKDIFPGETRLADLIGIVTPGFEQNQEDVFELSRKFDRFLSSIGLVYHELPLVENALAKLAFPSVRQIPIVEAWFQLTLDDARELVRQNLLPKIDGFAGPLNQEIIKGLLFENQPQSSN